MDLLTFQEAAELAGINVKTIHRHVARGKLQAVDTPLGRRLKRTDLDPYLQTRRDSEGHKEATHSDSPGQKATQSDNAPQSPPMSGHVPIEAMRAALEFAERRIAEERTRAEDAYQLALTAERTKMSLEVQLSQYQRVLSEQAESLAEERALRIAAEARSSMPDLPPKLDMPTPQRGWGQRLKGWLLGSKTG
jgi:excisionase family DNA binding protein